MKKLSLLPLLLLFGLGSPAAHAYLPVSSFTAMSVKMYAMYTTADPTCQTGLIATLPMSPTPQTINLVASPVIGTGALANPTNCVVWVMANGVPGATWTAGTYTGTTLSGGGTFSDNIAACNNGGSDAAGSICRSITGITWPAKIAADLTANGLTGVTTCAASPTGDEVIAVYISTNSKCTSVRALDTDISGCDPANGPTAFKAPTSAGDTANGINLSAPSAGASSYTFKYDLSQSCGASSSSACGCNGPPRFNLIANAD